MHHLKDVRKSVIHWSFEDATSDIDDVEAMLRSIIEQAIPNNLPLPQFIRQEIQHYRRTHAQPPASELSRWLCRVFKEINCDFYLIIDGLDQCGTTQQVRNRGQLLDVLVDLTSSEHGNLHLFLASKKENDIALMMDTMGFSVTIFDLNTRSSPDLSDLVAYNLDKLSVQIDEKPLREYFERRILAQAAKYVPVFYVIVSDED